MSDMRSKCSIRLHDMSLRDGMHTVRHQFSVEQMVRLARALDDAGVPLIEVTHGDGLGGSSVNYGFAKHSDQEYLSAVAPVMKAAKISALLVPGIGTIDDLRMAIECGISTVRIATHCTEADVSEQHIKFARETGLDTVGFLMMSHMIPADHLVEQAAMMESYGANCVYITDSAGYMLPEQVTEKISRFREVLDTSTEIGFHGHNNLGLGVANSIAAVQAGARRIDGSVAGFGAGAGNTALEVFAAVCDRMGIATGTRLDHLLDVAEDIAVPMMQSPPRLDRDSVVLGHAGVYSSFLLHAKSAAKKYDIPSHKILKELGVRKTVGGQEDMIEDVALDLLREIDKAPD